MGKDYKKQFFFNPVGCLSAGCSSFNSGTRAISIEKAKKFDPVKVKSKKAKKKFQ